MIPRIGNAKGDTNFGGLAGDASGEAMIELAKNFLESGEYEQVRFYLQGASNAGIPDHLRDEINELNMALARLPSKQHQANPSEDADPEINTTLIFSASRTRRLCAGQTNSWRLMPK